MLMSPRAACTRTAVGEESEADADAREEAEAASNATRLAQQLAQPSAQHDPLPPPRTRPLMSPLSAFPTSTWHADLPATGLPSLASWSAQGLKPADARRLEHVVSVYSLGFHQLIRAVRAGMVDPSGTVASLWKLFVFLLNDAMPDGSIYSLRIALMEREQAARSRELSASREAELTRLLKLETELQAQVQQLDQALRRVQAHRQNAEDARLEAMDSIDEQQNLQQAAAEEIASLEAQARHWESRFRCAHNRHRMLLEDVRQVSTQQATLRAEQYRLVNECARAEYDETSLRHTLESLAHTLTTMRERQKKLLTARAEANAALTRASDESRQWADRLIDAGVRVGELTSRALAKTKERLLVVQHVQKLKQELKDVVDQELSSCAAVESLTAERSTLAATVDTLQRSAKGLTFAVTQLRSELTHLTQRSDEQRVLIAEEEARMADMLKIIDEKQAVQKQIQDEISALDAQVTFEDVSLAEASRRFASAMSAVKSLTDSLRQAHAETQSLVRENRMLAAHDSQLENEVQSRGEEIEHHGEHVARRTQTLESEIKRHGEEIVASSVHSAQLQDETVAHKQRLMDLTAAMMREELAFDASSQQLAQQNLLLEGVEISAADTRKECSALEKELDRIGALRKIKRQELDSVEEAHALRVAAFQADISALVKATQEKTAHTQLLLQQMATLSVERQQMNVRHENELFSIADASRQLDLEQIQATKEQIGWIAAQQIEHASLQEKLAQVQAKVAKAKERTALLAESMAIVEGQQSAERTKLAEIDEQLEKSRRHNAAQSVIVANLKTQVSAAVALQADPAQDHYELHKQLEAIKVKNRALDQRKHQFELAARQRGVTSSIGLQAGAPIPG